MVASHADTSMLRTDAFGTMPAFATITAGGPNVRSAVPTRFATAAASRTSTGTNASRSWSEKVAQDLFQRVRLHVAQDDTGPGVLEGPRDAQTDARRHDCHHRDLPIEPGHRPLAPCSPTLCSHCLTASWRGGGPAGVGTSAATDGHRSQSMLIVPSLRVFTREEGRTRFSAASSPPLSSTQLEETVDRVVSRGWALQQLSSRSHRRSGLCRR
jgi:hypothetical protein